VTQQAEWLRRWGIDELVEEGKRIWREQASAPDVAAVRMRSRIGEAEALLEPSGLGAFLVLEWVVPTDGSSPPPNLTMKCGQAPPLGAGDPSGGRMFH
jgi:hypothetical protein